MNLKQQAEELKMIIKKGVRCDLCKNIICKYELDINSTGAIWLKDINKLICDDCAKRIAHGIIDNE